MSPSASPVQPKKALVIGASRGLGLALVREYLNRGWRVVATARAASGTELHELAAQSGGRLEIELLDINNWPQLESLGQRLSRVFDLLFVNAGVISQPPLITPRDVTQEEFSRVLVTNALSPMRVIEVLCERVSPTGTIAAMSSGLGSVANNENGIWDIYRCSKAALNQLMRSFAARHRDDRRTLLLIAPGWNRTDMGGPEAPFSPDETIPKVVDTVMRHAGQPGLAFLDYKGESVRW